MTGISEQAPFRLVHLSDVHFWRYPLHPLALAGKRTIGLVELLAGRARRFRLDRIGQVVDRVQQLEPDHLLVTGDLTTTALPAEFRDARRFLAPLLTNPDRATLIPGNHDRYTRSAARGRSFEATFGAFQADSSYPWLKWLSEDTAILGLDATRPHLTARGWLPPEQVHRARALLQVRPRRLIVACHYPIRAPEPYRAELRRKRLVNATLLRDWLATVGPHLYCCGHVHAAWAFVPDDLPDQVCLNAGAPLLRDRTAQRRPGFLEVMLEAESVEVRHHAWYDDVWRVERLFRQDDFFRAVRPGPEPGGPGPTGPG